VTAFAIGVLPDGTKIAVSGSTDKTVKIWNVETGADVHTIGHTRTGTCICTGGERRVNPACPAAGHSKAVTAVAISPRGDRVVSGSQDKRIKIWHAHSGAEVWSSACHDGRNGCVCEMRNQFDWDDVVGRFEEGCPVVGHAGAVTSVAFSPDGTHIVTGSEDTLIKIWHVETGTVVRTLKGHPDGVTGVRFNDDGTQVLSGDGNTVRSWDIASGRVVREETDHMLDEAGDVSFESEPSRLNAQIVKAHKCGCKIKQCKCRCKESDQHLVVSLQPLNEFQADMVDISGLDSALWLGHPVMPVAYFKAPQNVSSVRSHGGTICVGCDGGAVCILQAPFCAT